MTSATVDVNDSDESAPKRSPALGIAIFFVAVLAYLGFPR